MNKVLYQLVAFILLFTACNQEDSILQQGANPKLERDRFFGIKELTQTTTRAALETGLKWQNGQTIRIKFLNGSIVQKNFVKESAAEWLKYANLQFEYITSGTADVKIGFDYNGDYTTWSYVGTECTYVPQNTPSANFGLLDEDVLEFDESKAQVLQVFGHILGLVYEHQSPASGIQWKEALLRNYLIKNGWLEREVGRFFVRLNASQSNYTSFDPNSIMIYPISRSYTMNNVGYDMNLTLSQTDIDFIKTVYPKDESDEPILTVKVLSDKIRSDWHEFVITDDIIIDWGDGVRETLYCKNGRIDYTFKGITIPNMTGKRLSLQHTYSSEAEYTIKMYGKTDALRVLLLPGISKTMIDITKNEKLLYVDVTGSGLAEMSSIDVSKNLELQYLYCGYLGLRGLDVSKNSELIHLSCSNNKLSNMLDVTSLSKLYYLACDYNNLSSIKTHANLVYLMCSSNILASLNLQNNTSLTVLDCNENKLSSLNLSYNNELNSVACKNNNMNTLSLPNNKLLLAVHCSNNNLQDLNLAGKINLRLLECENNPFVSDQTKMLKIAQSLPNWSNGAVTGIIWINNATIQNYINSVCSQKKWKFMKP